MTPGAQDSWIEANGLRLHYRDWGGAGQQVVLLHGLASNCRIWDLVAPILALSFSVVALDQRGHGDSDKPDSGYDFATVTDDLHGFIRALNLKRPLIMGHSWGAHVGLEYAVSRPDILRGMCFVDGGVSEVSADPGRTREQAREEMAPPSFAALTLERLLKHARSWPLGRELTPELQEIVLANFNVLEDGTVRAKLSRDNHMQVVDAFWDHRPTALFPNVRCPVLLMPARMPNDDSPMARRFRRKESIAAATTLLPVSKAVWLEDSIHDVPLQRPELVAKVIIEHVEDGFFG